MAGIDGLSIRLLDVYGAVFSVCVENKAGRNLTLAGMSLQCGVQTRDRENAILFRAPLTTLYGSRQIDEGAEIFDVSIQGYGLADSLSNLALRHVSAIFKMIASSTPELSSKITDPAHRSRFQVASREFLDTVFKLQHDRSDNLLLSFRSYDGILHPELRSTFVGQDGNVGVVCTDVGNVALASWLAAFMYGSDIEVPAPSPPQRSAIPDYIGVALSSATSP